MTSIEDIKKLLESKSFTSARDLDEFEEKPDDKQNEVRLNCEPMVGMVGQVASRRSRNGNHEMEVVRGVEIEISKRFNDFRLHHEIQSD